MLAIRATIRGIAALCVLAVAMTATAGSFSISPIRVEFSGRDRVQVLTVRNEEPHSVVVQVRAVAWSQAAGDDVLEDTRDLLVTPPVFTLPANGQQIVRVALRRAVDPERELNYRLLLDEVPQPPSAEFTGLQVALRLSLPVFVQPARRAGPALVWQAVWQSDGHLRLKARNEGGAHAQVLDFVVEAADSASLSLHNAVARYLLPGSEAEWLLDVPENAIRSALLRIHGASDQGDFSAEFPAALP